jgi:hypothetical protein
MTGLWPQVERRWLFAIAAAFWAIAGGVLLGWTVVWLLQVAVLQELVLAHLGGAAAVLAERLIFLRVVRSNIRRLDEGPDRAWAPAFQTGRSYLVMAFMIAFGMALRMSPVSRVVLAVLYEAIGGGLLLGAYAYLRHFLTVLKR